MAWEEITPRGLYECDSGNAIMLPKGTVGRTKGRLIGCLVPIMCYDTELAFGHFGPRQVELMSSTLGD